MGQYVFCSIDVLMCSRFVILQAKHVLLITQQCCWSYTLSFLHVGLQKMFIIDMKKDRALAFYIITISEISCQMSIKRRERRINFLFYGITI